jgi:hypothetical protein
LHFIGFRFSISAIFILLSLFHYFIDYFHYFISLRYFRHYCH